MSRDQQGGRDIRRHRGLKDFMASTPSTSASTDSHASYDAAYFHAYAHVGVHEEMLKDQVRTETYRAAIQKHQDLIEDKVVLDVGCGTGILSIFCALAGARKDKYKYVYSGWMTVQDCGAFWKLLYSKHGLVKNRNRQVRFAPVTAIQQMDGEVYAVDASEIAVQAREIVKANNLSDKITVIIGRIEEVGIDEKVDVIISEWMGYMLLYESMLSSVIHARDCWLKPGGLILPSHATLYMASITHPERYSESIDFWRNVYGIDMSAMLPLAKQCAFEEPCIEIITGENVLTWPTVVKDIDCNTITVQELESITARFYMTSMMSASLHGFVLWFDVEFRRPSLKSSEIQSESPVDGSIYRKDKSNDSISLSGKRKRANPPDSIVLSTAPEEERTHWAQTVLYIYDPIEVKQDQEIEGSVTVSKSKENPRFLNIRLEYNCGGRGFVKECIMS